MPTPTGTSEYYAKRARKEGNLARSYYKLEEMDQRISLLKRGDKVVDLGCWPGAWSKYAAERVGPTGRVLGIDMKEVTAVMPSNVKTVVEDAYDFRRRKTPKLDVVLSDMAPVPTGVIMTDHGRSVQLVELVIGIADAKLAVGGSMLVKIWDGVETKGLMKQLKLRYEDTRILRPRATRSQSTELYLLGLGKRDYEVAMSSARDQPSYDARGVKPPPQAPQRRRIQEDFTGW